MAAGKEFFTHETVIVDENVSIGKNTKIWCFSHILRNASIGERCNIGQNCMIGANVRIGSGVKIQNNVSVYESVEIEDDVFLGPSMVFTNVINPRAFIERKHEFRRTLVKKGASIGANATVVCGVTIGKYSFIGAGSVVSKDVPDFALAYGVPARRHGWVGISGNKLEFDASGFAVDTYDNKKYVLKNGKVSIISDY
ncbi:N-acetyltransferase [bacterium]|nr:N-acetyltransferase [bacterium]